ncbi:hypothetical protein KGMB02408_15060 [Bacteroides faecalis]|uniref:Uncharacterized protein n=1 Tax=Bacteroides faecalis TaxID=2447885 RepID=A0A401LSZ3_9BACE|nr:hypothetical protein KGMB02408_15060 [Bacteroides faecalis]
MLKNKFLVTPARITYKTKQQINIAICVRLGVSIDIKKIGTKNTLKTNRFLSEIKEKIIAKQSVANIPKSNEGVFSYKLIIKKNGIRQHIINPDIKKISFKKSHKKSRPLTPIIYAKEKHPNNIYRGKRMVVITSLKRKEAGFNSV